MIGTYLKRTCGFAAALVLIGGCAADPPKPYIPATPSVERPTPSVIDLAEGRPPGTLPGAGVHEAIETQWVEFWTTYRDIIRTPDDEREAVLGQVAESPLKDQLIEIARTSEAEGIDNYGTVIHHISWDGAAVAGTTAELSDCQDGSSTGTINIHTGQVVSVGQARASFRGSFTLGSDGVWRVTTLTSQGVGEC